MNPDTPDPLTIPEAREDITHRDRAGRMSGALAAYARHRQYAFVAEANSDPRSAAGHRADARFCLHTFPDLLVMVEPGEPQGVEAVTATVALAGECGAYSVPRECGTEGCAFETTSRSAFWAHVMEGHDKPADADECECGHTAHWHSHDGTGVCEHGDPCECERFWIDDGRNGPDEDRAYDEWRDR